MGLDRGHQIPLWYQLQDPFANEQRAQYAGKETGDAGEH